MSDVYKKFTPDLYEAVYMVDEEQNGMRLDQYCSTFLVSFSRQQIKKKIKDGEIKIFNRPYPHKASVKVYHREKIQVKTPRGTLEDEYWLGEKISLKLKPDIIYENENLLVISKPAFMATHPTGKHLFNCATVFLEDIYKQTIYSIHRLDRETSGVLLMAKNSQMAKNCTELFEKNTVSKAYFFIAHQKSLEDFPFIASERLGNDQNFTPRNFNHCYQQDSNLGKSAETHFEKLHQEGSYVLGLAFPKTGRQHQIRAHAAYHGYPLLGDKLYNGDPKVFMRFKDLLATAEDHKLMQIPRHALHAIALKVNFNASKSQLFQDEIPFDLKAWIKAHIKETSIEKLEEKAKSIISKRFELS